MGGGVGEAYPGSTGGEIFNCYEGNHRNEASGNYSTAGGFKNKARGDYSVTYGHDNNTGGDESVTFGHNNINHGINYITCGYNNTVAGAGPGGCVFGSNNNVSFGGYIIGNNNSSSGFVIGANNQNEYSTNVNGILIGYGLSHRNQNGSFMVPSRVISIGRYNASTDLSSPIIIFGCGQDSSNPKNALEINNSSCKILNNLQLNTDSTEVNAITPAQSSPASADDMTLVTKSYVASQVTSKSLSYQPASEQQLNIYTSYSIATLLGQATWDFPFSGGGSMDFVFSYDSAGGRNIWYRCHVPLPSYLNTQVTPKIYVALAQISHYPVTNDSNGELQGILLEYDTVAKTIQFIGGEGVIVNNGSDTLQTAYNQGNLHPWFWGLTCNTFI